MKAEYKRIGYSSDLTDEQRDKISELKANIIKEGVDI